MKKRFTIPLMLAIIAGMSQCNNETKPEETTKKTGFIKPVNFPDTHIPGFRMPEDSNIINSWIDKQDNQKIAEHGWGIWTGLNMNSGEQAEGQDLRVFETWLTPEDMQQLIVSEEDHKAITEDEVKLHRGSLHKPHQFLHKQKEVALRLGITNIDSIDNARITGFVKYDPSAAKFAVKNKLFDSAVLQGMLTKGMTDIPDFPNTGITTKPVFEIFVTSADTYKRWGGCYRLNVWPGTPAVPKAYGEGSWPGWVYVDPNNGGQGKGGVDTGQGKTPENTYNVNDFVHFKLDQRTADELNASQHLNAKAGDIALLVAMHVTSKETKRWTWQTFWWTPDADNPPAPSSAMVAAARPKELTGAPRHYAMAPAYTYLYPNQPYTGGNNIGTSIYAFNPYLEASFTFGPIGSNAALNDPAYVVTNGKRIENNWGVRTNCMSCHAHANYAPASVPQTNLPQYLGDTYVDLNDTIYKQCLKLDFAWSISGNLITAENRSQFKK